MARAARRGHGCRSVVTVDLDAPPCPGRWLLDAVAEYFEWRASKLGASAAWCGPSPGRRGLHCVACFPVELGEEERLLLAAALGDDPARVLNNMRRLALRGRLLDLLFTVKERLRAGPA